MGLALLSLSRRLVVFSILGAQCNAALLCPRCISYKRRYSRCIIKMVLFDTEVYDQLCLEYIGATDL